MESRRLFRCKPDNCRMSVDLKSEEAISNLPDLHAESCRYLTPRKSRDCSILRFETQDSPRIVSSSGTPLWKISKNLDPRDTNHRNRRIGEPFWCGRRDLNSRTIDWMVSRVVGLEAHWTLPCYVLDQARLRPHTPRVYLWVHLSYDSKPRRV